jgi:glycosyltransferase involved in cell wall biosynthesis
MARVGINPARRKVSNYRPAKVTAAVLVYIPYLEGYFEQRLQVLQLVLGSLQRNTPLPHDLVVFDNGSCQAVKEYLAKLQLAGKIDYLISSKQNIGKIGAFRIIFNAALGDIVAFCDDDILFYPGWLEAHLEILEQFPNVGMVSGVPVRNASGHARKSLDKLVQDGAPGLSTSYERRIPDQWEEDWAISTGRNYKDHLQATKGHQDLVLRMGNTAGDGLIEAIGSANHFQFVAYKQVLLQALPHKWSGRLMGSMVEFDEAVDSLGYLRLSTTDRFTRHIGNTISADIVDEAEELGIEIDGQFYAGEQATAGLRSRQRHFILRIPGSRRVLSSIYNRIFDILYR